MLAAFLRWHMPLGAGGVLADQEAWDVQAFVDSQSCPKQPPTQIPAPQLPAKKAEKQPNNPLSQ